MSYDFHQSDNALLLQNWITEETIHRGKSVRNIIRYTQINYFTFTPANIMPFACKRNIKLGVK